MITDLPPPPRLDIKDPCITQSLAIIIYSPSDQQLGILLSKVEAAGCMGVSPHWPRSSLSLLKFGPVLTHKTCHMMSSCDDMQLCPCYLDKFILPIHAFVL